MNRPLGFWVGISMGILGGVLGIGIAVWYGVSMLRWNVSPAPPPAVSLDSERSFLLLATRKAAVAYTAAIGDAKEIHPDAIEALFSPEELPPVRALLQKQRPFYAMIFILPDELDVNFAWEWLRLSTEVDDDPFVDVRTGFITGTSPAAAAGFIRRIREAVGGQISLPGAFVDNLGPNSQAAASAFNQFARSFFLPVYAQRFPVSSISHGKRGFTKERMDSMNDAGFLHFGGHGYPNRIVDSLNARWVGRLKISPCVVFNGACYTGVTCRWFDVTRGTLREKTVPLDQSFCLEMLSNNVIGYLAALHPDHGIPVYQEMEYLAYTGAPLGDLMKHTHDGVILASGAKRLDYPRLTNGMQNPARTPSDVMLMGTAARVLYGDPSLIVADPFTATPFEITVSRVDETSLAVRAVLQNTELRSTFTDTYHADLASNRQLFNDTARFVIDLPEGWDSVSEVEVRRVSAGNTELRHRLVGFGVEKHGQWAWLHVQVDVPTSGYMQSEFRSTPGMVELTVRK